MIPTFELGSTVRLKSGGPKMTVDNMQDNGAGTIIFVAWFEGTLLRRNNFDSNSLAIIVDEPPITPPRRIHCNRLGCNCVQHAGPEYIHGQREH